MFKGVDVVCFTACYSIAFVFELARLRFAKDSRLFVLIPFVLTALGAVAHASFLYYNDLLQNDRFFSSAGGWFSVLAFAVVLVELYLTLVSKTQFSLFLLPLTLSLIAVSLCVGNVAFPPAATCVWVRATHASALLLAALLSFFGAVSGYMYFWQRNRLRRNVAENSLALPSLEWLSRACRFAANMSVVALGIGVASGFYLKIFSGTESRFDLASIGTPFVFVAALLSRFPKRRARAVDVCATNAIHNFVVGAAMGVLLFSVAFGPNSHWNPPTHAETNANEQVEADESTLAVPPAQ